MYVKAMPEEPFLVKVQEEQTVPWEVQKEKIKEQIVDEEEIELEALEYAFSFSEHR